MISLFERNAPNVVRYFSKGSDSPDRLSFFIELKNAGVWVGNFGEIQRNQVLLVVLVKDDHFFEQPGRVVVAFFEVQVQHFFVPFNEFLLNVHLDG